MTGNKNGFVLPFLLLHHWKEKNNASIIEWMLLMTYEQFVYRYRLGMGDYNVIQKSSIETSAKHPHSCNPQKHKISPISHAFC